MRERPRGGPSPAWGWDAERLEADGGLSSPCQVLPGLGQADAAEDGGELDQLHPEENHFQRSPVRCWGGKWPPPPTHPLTRPRPLASPHCAPRPRAPALPRWGPLLRGGPRCSPAPRGAPGLPLSSFCPPSPPPPAGSPRPSRPPLRGRPPPRAAGKDRAGPNKELFNFLFYLNPAVCCFLPRRGLGGNRRAPSAQVWPSGRPVGPRLPRVEGGRGNALLGDGARSRHFRRAGFTSGAVRRLRGDGAMEAAAERKVGPGPTRPVPTATGGPGGAGAASGRPHLASPRRDSGRRRRRRPTSPGRKMTTTFPTCPLSSASSRW